MTKTAKILIGVGGALAVVLIVVLIAGFFAVRYLMNRVSADREEGKTFAQVQSIDQKGCISEGLKRARSIEFLNVGKGTSLSTFVEGCLRAATPNPDLCTGVPGMSITEKDAWITSQCQLAGMDKQKSGCFFVFAGKHNFCNGVK